MSAHDVLDERRSAGALLAVLINTANDRGDASVLLHEHVTLHRLDGERLDGRAAVVDAICTRGPEASFRVIATHAEMIRVALHIEGLPGHLPFTMTARVLDGVLREIWMEG